MSRRLAAVAFADVAGFSRLMAKDDVNTIAVWGRIRREVMLPHMERHGGRVAQTPGDAILMEFQSGVGAVNWAIDVQQSIQNLEDEPFEDEQMQLRIGINVDDVIDDEGTLMSDGVNIAARIHQAAMPGEIIVTRSVKELVRNKIPVSFRDLGTPPLKNIDRPIRLFVVDSQGSDSAGSMTQPYLLWSSRPTLAVLPFRTLGDDDQDDYFGEGMTEDIITGLSRSRSLFVIARASMLRFRDRAEDHETIAKALGVKYILEGTVRRQSNRVRINTELIEVDHGRSVWAERYDGSDEELFEFQDRIASSIVASLEPRVRAAETARISNRPTDSLDAYDCVLKALSRLYRFTEQSYAETEKLLQRAVELDPNYAQAHAYLAWRLNFWIAEGHSVDPRRDRNEALRSSLRAVTLDPDDAFALAVRGHVVALLDRRPFEAQDVLEQAVRLDENSPVAWALSALAKAYCGEGNEARRRLKNVWQLSPYDPLNFFFWIAGGIAEFVEGRYDESIIWLRKSARSNPRFVASLRMLSAALGLSGDLEEARAVGKRLMDVEPTFRVSTFVSWYPLQRQEDLERLAEGLRRADVPE